MPAQTPTREQLRAASVAAQEGVRHPTKTRAQFIADISGWLASVGSGLSAALGAAAAAGKLYYDVPCPVFRNPGSVQPIGSEVYVSELSGHSVYKHRIFRDYLKEIGAVRAALEGFVTGTGLDLVELPYAADCTSIPPNVPEDVVFQFRYYWAT